MSTTQESAAPTFTSPLLQAMYESLHAEITARLELRQNIVTFTLIVAASLFGLGLQSWTSAVTVLCYPVLALFLGLMWSQHDAKIGQIAAYLREIEDAGLSGYQGWERWRRQHFQAKRSHIAIPAKGVFLVSEVLAMVIGLARFVGGETASVGSTVLFIGLLVTDLVALVLTALVITHQRQRSEKGRLCS